VCASVCYACSGWYCMPENKRIYQRWLRETRRKGFGQKIIREIAKRGYELFRIHSAGDFYDAPYIRKWISIVKACPQTTFVSYTRTWRCPDKLAALRELAALPNMIMWWSADSETHAINGRPPRISGVRVAYLVIDYDEWVPAYADLVFRHRRKTIEKYRNGRLMCPAENGIEYKYHMTCGDCSLCYRNREVPKKCRDSSSSTTLAPLTVLSGAR